jgi:hypothetical protein
VRDQNPMRLFGDPCGSHGWVGISITVDRAVEPGLDAASLRTAELSTGMRFVGPISRPLSTVRCSTIEEVVGGVREGSVDEGGQAG